ncbi:MAG: hypothetical protein JWQ90_2759 [Hydrocarboniphaga sp.]|uniref:hypothetical protein n=1 Tax=Hydrocarboniphaga sp. TaxID=2033016 RepID=UPI002632467A|nr:hypothetical protein [Hydrocarboniphaga sp.]MDB5970309.1 hypothetical protein [Hydrocarboniphaga sp.]
MNTAPYDHPLNLTTQAIMTYGSWGLTLVLLAAALRLCLRERTPFYVLIVLAAMFGALFEPLYDVGFMLLFYTPGLWTHFTAFDVPQPLWTHSGYAVLYAAPAIAICKRIGEGRLTRSGLYKWAGIELAMSCSFEMIGINGGAYAYWGPHVLRIFDYPLVIGVLETAQVICFSVAAAELRKRSSGTVPLLGLFVLFPCMFYFANFGAGAPTIVALHMETTSTALIMAATLLSIGFAAILIRTAASLLPAASAAPLRRALRVPAAG